ncbi:MAG: Uma2 family endonuclease [Planctomycetes bacterium]|nr:Uma2 family endonuclease [Planctomycetota bacterium]
MNEEAVGPSCSSVSPSASVPPAPVWPLRVEQFHQMLRAGILTENDPVELLEGWLVAKMGKNPAHRAATRLVRAALERVVPAGWYVDSQEPITTQDSEPEPDVSVIRGDTRMYLDRHPGPEDVGVVVEVAEASIERDRNFKMRLYARAGISIYWLLSLVDNRLEVYTGPTGPGPAPNYRVRAEHGREDMVPVILDGREIARIPVKDLLP